MAGKISSPLTRVVTSLLSKKLLQFSVVGLGVGIGIGPVLQEGERDQDAAVDIDHLVDVLHAGDRPVQSGQALRPVDLLGQGTQEDVVDQGGLADVRAAHNNCDWRHASPDLDEVDLEPLLEL